MSILKFVRPLKRKGLDLPEPTGPLSEKIPSTAIASANAKVEKALEEDKVKRSESRRGPRGKPYLYLMGTQKFEIGKRAAEHNVTPTLCYYKEKYLDLPLTETSVRRFKNAYKDEVAIFASCMGRTDIEFLKELSSKKSGRPLATGDEVDKQIQHYLLDMRKRGLTVNTSVAIAVGEGILLSKNASLSTDILTKEWAKYLFKRMGLVERKGNTKAKVDVEKFFEVKRLFLQDIKSVLSPWMRYQQSW